MPRFDPTPEGVDELLLSENVEIEYGDTFVDSEGNEKVWPEHGHWSLFWEQGVIGFDGIPRGDRDQARLAAAAFIHLWKLGVSADHAEMFAQCFARRYKVHREGSVVVYEFRGDGEAEGAD